jgi:ribonuclease G
MAKDATKHSILPLSKFGLMQITRQRVRPEMFIDTVEKCPTCGGTGEIASSIVVLDEINNTLSFIRKHKPDLKKLILKVHPFLASFLIAGFPSLRYKWARKHNCRLKIKPIHSIGMLEYRFVDKNDNDILV